MADKGRTPPRRGPRPARPPKTDPEAGAGERRRVFISYKRDVKPDQPLATQVFQELSRDHDVFIDRTLTVGGKWGEQIERELGRADFVVALLSAESVQSEMVGAEIATAHRLASERGRPVILPVRVAYTGTLRYPLSAYLDPINWARWDGKRDTAALVHQLRQAIAGADLPDRGSANGGGDRAVLAPPASAQPATLELPGGTMDPESAFYIERDSDRVALDLVGLPGITLTIKAPRQMGKSSLLLRTLQAAGRAGKRIAFLDFQLLDRSTLRDADAFFRQFCAWFSAELGADDRHQEVWATPLGNVLRCTNYVRDHLLRSQDSVVLALDEVETVFDSAFRSDFFGMLRSWHNARRAQSPWKRLDLVLVTSTEPHQFILNPTQSPFNVGESLALADFTPAQAAELNRRHGSPLGPAELARLDELLAGHPFLTRRALYLVAGGRMDVTALFARAADESGPFGDHLCHYLLRLQAQAGLLRAVAECLSKRQCKDERLLALLLGTGLVRRDGAGLAPRCRLYDDFFRDRLHA